MKSNVPCAGSRSINASAAAPTSSAAARVAAGVNAAPISRRSRVCAGGSLKIIQRVTVASSVESAR